MTDPLRAALAAVQRYSLTVDPDDSAYMELDPDGRYVIADEMEDAALAVIAASPTAGGEREYRFTTWDDTSLVVTVDDDDPGDMGEPRMLVDYDNGPTTYLSVKSCETKP